MIILLLSRAIEANKHEPSTTLNSKQLQLAEILEMIHTAR
jgi:geranylgeranyl pyrophosphate synthase